MIHFYSRYSQTSTNDYCSKMYRNNIGHRSFTDSLCYPVIDAVYTWVNGSDPEWLKQMLYYKSLTNKRNRTTQEEVEEFLSSTASNRFRDSDELKYACFLFFVFVFTYGCVDIHFVQLKGLLHGYIRYLSSPMARYLLGWMHPIQRLKL
jgi:hypothetical protein